MSARTQLEAYLSEFRKRLKSVIVARGAAVLAVTALALTLAAVFIGTRQAFADSVMIGARVLLVLALAALAAVLLVLPLRKLKRTEGVADIERRAPDFEGRIETYKELDKRAETDSGPPVFLALLAEDALRLARRIPVALKVRNWEISTPAVAAGIAALALVWFAAFGPDNWRYGVRHLWAGWALSDTLPPQRVAVSPGDGAVRRGGDLLIEARAEGFDPVEATVFALFEGGEWQSAVMDEAGGAFGFRFYGVREPLRYYVEAAGIRSAEYAIDVVDLPRVSNVRLTYHYPQWTRQQTRTEDPGGDIEAVAGTQVEIEITTDQPLNDAALVVNGEAVTMTTDGATATAVLTVEEEGEYHVATSFNEAPVQLSDNYFIDVQEDNRPVVNVVKPGRDWRASNIEEVLVRVEASDDFNLDRLELNYAVNGGEWQVASLEADGDYTLAENVLYLEEMRAERTPASTRAAPSLFDIMNADERDLEPRDEAPETSSEPSLLEPGDVISYYVEAFDRDASTRTDLFFIEVQPFDRSFSQAMAGGGGGGGGGGGPQNEISQRQKEILVATWNLIREQEEQTGFQGEQQIEDNGALLAELQRTLAEQARTLASRTRARQLTSADDKIQRFVQALESAADAMDPAAEQLADTSFDEAVPSEQAALQHLLRAEAVFTEIQVAFQRGGGGGGGGFAGRDLAELFELEMDLEKNQYETEAPVAFNQSPEEQGVDEAIRKLQELARRQENLARQANQRGLTEQERWQQEQLRRETEELRRELEQLQRQAANQQQAQGQQQGQQGQQGQPGQPGQPGQFAQGAGQGQQSTAEALEQLDNALQAMNRASGQAGQDEMTPEQMRRAIEEARRQLDRALEQMTAQRQAAVQEAFSDLADRSQSLFNEQRETEAELQQVARQALQGREEQGFLINPLSAEEAYDLSDRKWNMSEELEALQQDIQRVAQQFDEETPTASEELEEALGELQRAQVGARLSTAAYRIRRGAAAEAAALEGVTTNALDDLRAATDEALAIAMREAREGVQPAFDPTAELVAELQTLRRELANALPTSQPGQPGQHGQQPGQQGGQPGQSAQNGAQAGGAYGGGDRWGGWRNGPYNRGRAGIGAWDPRSIATFDPETRERLEGELEDAGAELIALGTQLRNEGLTAEELEALRRLGTALRQGLPGNPELIEQEYLAMLNLIEQLELQLAGEGTGLAETGVRTEAPVQVAEAYQEAVAEYYRRLSRAGSTP